MLREFWKDSGQYWGTEVVDDDRQPQVALSVTPDGLEALEDDEARPWYFVAPRELLGDWAVAYGGKETLLLFRCIAVLPSTGFNAAIQADM